MLPLETTSAFVQALRDYHLLPPAQLDELARDPQLARLDVRPLAKELVQRGWLTPYQVNRLFAGRVQELLLGPYVLLERLGEGGMGQVFKARHQVMNRLVALKVIRKARLAHPEAVRRFQREIQAAAQLSHPNIVIAHDANQVGDVHFFAMEYVEGIDLARLMKVRKQLAIHQACDYVRQAALGLQHAHERGMVHRDVKPANLMLASRDVVVKVLDLGLARLNQLAPDAEASGPMTQEGAIMGTPDYMAPEQATDSRRADIRADIYSLGCTLYHLLTGQVPFPAGALSEKLVKHQLSEPEPVEKLRPDVPRELVVVVRKMMAKKPAGRFATPAEVARALAPFCGTSGPPPEAIPVGDPRGPFVSQSNVPTVDASVSTPDVVPSAVPVGLASLPLPQTEKEPAREGARAPLPRRGFTGWWRSPKWVATLGAAGLLLAALLALLLSRPWAGKPPAEQLLALPEQDRLPWYPKELVAVLGEDRGRHWGPIRCAAYHPDGKHVASGGDDGVIRLWTLPDLREKWHIPDHKGPVWGLDFSPDQRHLASCSADGTVRLWDLRTLREVRQFPGHGGAVRVRFSPDGLHLFTSNNGMAYNRYQVDSGLVVQNQGIGPGEQPSCAYLSPDPRWLISGNVPGQADDEPLMKLWDTGQLTKPVQVFRGVKKPFLLVSYSPQKKQALSYSGDGTLRLWDAESGRELRALQGFQQGPNLIGFSADGRWAYACCTDNTIHVWEVESGRGLSIFKSHQGPIWSATPDPDGRHLVTGSDDRTLRRWDVDTGKEEFPVGGHTHAAQSVAFSPDGKQILSGGGDNLVRLWRPEGKQVQKELQSFGPHIGGVRFVSFLPGLGRLFSVDGGNNAREWEREKTGGVLAFQLLGPNNVPGECFAFTSDNRRLLAGTGTWLTQFDLVTGNATNNYPGHVAGVLSVAYSPDGRRAFSAGIDPILRYWDLETNKELGRFVGHSDVVWAVAFSADGQQGYSASADRTVCVWDLAVKGGTRKCQELEGELPAGLSMMAFAPDLKLLAAAGQDGRVVLWDVASGQRRNDWKNPGPVNRLAFAPDGKHLATANANGTVYVYRLDTSSGE